MKRPVLIVAGPTASGKSALAADAAAAFSGTVINGDSMQIYRELRLLTARPSIETEARVPHRLYGILPVTERCSTGHWLSLALAEIETAWRDERLPIVVGGTGLYLKALSEGLSPVPDIPEAVRQEARARHARIGGAAMRAELAHLDPDAAARLPAGDSQRLIRAYEVVRATGRPLSELHRSGRPRPPLDAEFATLVLMPPRAELYAAINARLDWMVAAGALAEVAAIEGLDLDPSLPAAKALGVRELRRHLRGEIDLDVALSAAKQASRNYAKRQMTWFRNKIVNGNVLNEKYSESINEKIFSFIRQFLLTAQL